MYYQCMIYMYKQVNSVIIYIYMYIRDAYYIKYMHIVVFLL